MAPPAKNDNALLRLLAAQQMAAAQGMMWNQNGGGLPMMGMNMGHNNAAMIQAQQALMFHALLSQMQQSSSSSSRPPPSVPIPGSFEEAMAKLTAGSKTAIPSSSQLEPGEIPKTSNRGATATAICSSSSTKIDLSTLECSPSPSTSIDHTGLMSEVVKRRPPVTDTSIVKIPIVHGWRRQTYIRELSSNGVKGDVVYFAPTGKKLASYSEVIRYLSKNPSPSVSRDQFTFSSKVIVGDFLVVSKTENGKAGLATFTEEQVNTELKRLQDEKVKKLEEERERREGPMREKKEAAKKEKEAMKEARKKEGKDKTEKEEIEGIEVEGGERAKRRPVEDLLLEETRPLPDFSRIDNLELDGNAFADALMVTEFLQNFAEILDIDTSSIPSICSLSSGLAGDSVHSSLVLSTLSILLSHSLRSLPQSRKAKTVTGKRLSEIPLDNDNRDEMLRLFLLTSDGHGPTLSSHLQSSSFLSLSSSNKASILACLVNQLVCSPLVTRQLDSHLEELSRLKGDRWMREGKIRALRNVQDKRRRKEKKIKKEEGEEGSERDGRSPTRTSEGMDKEEEKGGSEGGSRPGTPIEQKHKNYTPGIGQCEILTEEEEAMNNDQMEVVIGELSKDSDTLSSQIHNLNSRVRVFPFGEDRYHRQYWQLSSRLPVLVESIESGHTMTNPACDMSVLDDDPDGISLSSNWVHPDVCSVMEDIIDCVVNGTRMDRKKKSTGRRMGNGEKRGWWTVAPEHLEQWRANLHGRGNRERCVHRLLLRQKFLDEIYLGYLKVDTVRSLYKNSGEEKETEKNVEKFIEELESALDDAGFLVKEVERKGKNLKERLIQLEEAIDRKYIGREIEKEDDEDEGEEGEGKKEEEQDRGAQWKQFAMDASTPYQLSLAVQLLSSLIDWDASGGLWLCCHCLHPSSISSPFLSCLDCSIKRVHPHCLSSSSSFRCLSCLDKSTVQMEGDKEDCDEEEGTEEKRGAKRRAEPNSFIVPSAMVSELGRSMLDEMEIQKGVGPFLAPVDIEEIPQYAALIEKPMDLGTIRTRLEDSWYENADDFYADVELVFTNCRTFNEDESPIGEAGIRLHKFFTKRWRQLKYNLSKRVKRMRL